MNTIVWQMDPLKSWEPDWIEYVFSKTPHTTVIDTDQKQFIDNSYIVYNSHVNIVPYIEKMVAANKRFGLIHLSDEWDRDSTDHYKHAHVVLRNYYRSIDNTNVMFFPLGWMVTFPHTLPIKSTWDREFTWSFSGVVTKSTRLAMAEAMETVPNGCRYFKPEWENWGSHHGHALTPTQMADMYNNSLFVPCPRGNQNVDSFRVTEALQMGALPIVEKSDYWANLYGQDHPLIEIENWQDAPAVIKHLMSNMRNLDIQRALTYAWWIRYCNNLKNKITTSLIVV
jgi:hypothetical protein